MHIKSKHFKWQLSNSPQNANEALRVSLTNSSGVTHSFTCTDNKVQTTLIMLVCTHLRSYEDRSRLPLAFLGNLATSTYQSLLVGSVPVEMVIRR